VDGSGAHLAVGAEIEAWVRDTPRHIVAVVTKADDQQVVLADHNGAVWTIERGDLEWRAATPRARRRYRHAVARSRFEAMSAALRRSIDDQNPLRAATLADESTESLEVVGTPFGPFIWPRRRTPSQGQRKEWARMARDMGSSEADMVRYGARIESVSANRFIPSAGEVEDLLELERMRLLEDEEQLLVGEWASFWAAHPGAVHGMVIDGGSIVPLTYDSAA
jgi:hypothetical protein